MTAMIGERIHASFSAELAAFLIGETTCDRHDPVSGGTDLVRYGQPAMAMAYYVCGGPEPHLRYHYACEQDMLDMIGATHAEAPRCTVLFRSDHDERCTLEDLAED